jgi:outer membrane translocation and assembly module TamA
MMKYPIAWLTFYSQVFIQFLKGVCLSALAAVLFGVFFLICVNQRESVATLKDIHRTVLVIGGAAGELEKSSREWRAASAQSEEISKQTLVVLQNVGKATANLDAAAAGLNTLIAHTDDSLNSVLVPQLAQTVAENDKRLAELVEDTDKTVLGIAQTSSQATAAMSQATQTLADAGKILGDPANQQTVQNVQQITKNTAETTAHLDAAAADIQVKVHQMTRPASFVKRMAEAVLTLAAPVVSIFK